MTSGVAAAFGWVDVATLNDLGVAVDGLPTPAWPSLGPVPALIVPGARRSRSSGSCRAPAISANFVEPRRHLPGRVARLRRTGCRERRVGLLQGMPVGGSVSASALEQGRRRQVASGADHRRDRDGVVIVVFGDAIGNVAMPALAGLLILIGDPHRQARRPAVGVAHRHRAEGGARRHVRADDADPAAVRRPGRGRAVGRPPRHPAVEPGHDRRPGPRRRGARDRDRSADRAARRARSSCCSRTAASSSPRRRSSRQRFRRSGAVVRLRRDPPAARPLRSRHDLHGRPATGTRSRSTRSARSS